MRRFAYYLVGAAIICANGGVWAQAKVSKDQLVGSWQVTSVSLKRSDGTSSEPFGATPNGQLIFSPSGRYSFVVMRPDMPKIAAKDRMKGTDDENRAIVQGSLVHFGRYTINETEGSYTLQIEGSSYAADVGTTQTRSISKFSGDEFEILNRTPTSGASAQLTFKRNR